MAPAPKLVAEFPVSAQSVSVSVLLFSMAPAKVPLLPKRRHCVRDSVPLFRMAPPPPPEPLPPVRARFWRVTVVPLFTVKMRFVPGPPLMVTPLAMLPALMCTSLPMTISLPSMMEPVNPGAKVMVSMPGSMAAPSIACRSEPGPLSAVVVTTGGAERSTAPISARALPLPSPSCGLAKPRWSVVAVLPAAASMAGLPGSGGIVCVGPP